MMGFYDGYMGFGFGWIFMVLFWVIIVWLILGFMRGGRHWRCFGHGHHGRHSRNHGDDAMDILRQRYAKGEITKEKFEEMKAELEK